MKLLLDTHTLLWSLFDRQQLSNTARESILDPENAVYASVISFWEISLKYNLGKLSLKKIKPDELPYYAEKSGYEILEISPGDASSFYRLPVMRHKDPFDRLIIWQAMKNDMALATRDKEISDYLKYGLKIIW